MSLIDCPEFEKVGLKKLAVTENQLDFLDAMRCNAYTFVQGPAGTGKTFLATLEAIRAVESVAKSDKKIQRVLFLRPAITAGESLGFLPGDLEEKTAYYMHPFEISLKKGVPLPILKRLYKDEPLVGPKISFETLSYLQGETWERTFIVVDEAQNCTIPQIKMLLTRLGKHSKMVLVGDIEQSYIMNDNGFADAIDFLPEIPGIAFCELTGADNMRHPLVKAVAAAYEKRDRKNKQRYF